MKLEGYANLELIKRDDDLKPKRFLQTKHRINSQVINKLNTAHTTANHSNNNYFKKLVSKAAETSYPSRHLHKNESGPALKLPSLKPGGKLGR